MYLNRRGIGILNGSPNSCLTTQVLALKFSLDLEQ